MIWIMVAVVLVVLVAALALMAKKRPQQQHAGADEPWPLYSKNPVMSAPEQVLYHRLVQALPECIVLAQVQLSRLLGVKSGNDFVRWNNRISQKSVDFVICLKDSTVVAVVELDDTTHERKRRQAADADKNKALTSAGVSIVRWNVTSLPDETTIRAAFTT